MNKKMTLSSIATLTGKTKKTVATWAKTCVKTSQTCEEITQTCENIAQDQGLYVSISGKIEVARKTSKPAEFTLEETICIIRAGGNQTLADLLAQNARETEASQENRTIIEDSNQKNTLCRVIDHLMDKVGALPQRASGQPVESTALTVVPKPQSPGIPQAITMALTCRMLNASQLEVKRWIDEGLLKLDGEHRLNEQYRIMLASVFECVTNPHKLRGRRIKTRNTK